MLVLYFFLGEIDTQISLVISGRIITYFFPPLVLKRDGGEKTRKLFSWSNQMKKDQGNPPTRAVLTLIWMKYQSVTVTKAEDRLEMWSRVS